MNSLTKVLIIVGPTSSGKSALAVALAKRFGGEIISADSRQVYRGLNIGTGKIKKREMKGVPHHLLDVVSPKKKFTAHDFATRAREAIEDISSRGNMPIITGGTGLYIDVLTERITLPNVEPNPALRETLRKKSAEQLYVMLKKIDPKRAKSMNTPSERNNKVRLIRALEITHADHVPVNYLRNRYDALWIGIVPPLGELEKKIRTRLRARMERGMVAEAQELHAAGLSYKRMHELGLEYRFLAAYLQGKLSRAQMTAKLNRAIRKYAKRQIVYWKRNGDIVWHDPTEFKRISNLVTQWL